MNVTTHDCIMHARGEKCGPTWYQFTHPENAKDGEPSHTLGGCSTAEIDPETGEVSYVPFEGEFTGRATTDRQTGQVTLELVDSKGETRAALAYVPKEST